LEIGCIVLAGGRGSRFGRDKAWLELKGQNLLQRQVANVGFLADEVIIVAAAGQKLPSLKTGVGLRIVTDIASGHGPLIGIYTGLLNSTSLYNLVLACDMPFINNELIRYMINLATGFDAIVPKWRGWIEPLHAIYSRRCLSAMKNCLTRGELKIDSFLAQVSVRYIDKTEIEPIDPQGLSFYNINTERDLEKAEQLLGGSSS
jgi:molybdopterin-guanine dinucleotide biosynthesis protein A